MVQISLQNSGEKVVFLRGVPWNPPWAPTDQYLGHLSVNKITHSADFEFHKLRNCRAGKFSIFKVENLQHIIVRNGPIKL